MNLNYKQFSAYIVDPDNHSRMQLRQVATAVGEFTEVFQVFDLKECQKKLEDRGSPIDILFLSHRFNKSDIHTFIQGIRGLPASQDSAVIFLTRPMEQDSQFVMKDMIHGADGMLFEPYSVEQLLEITRLAYKVKKERTEAREAAALKFLVKDFARLTDQIAALRSVGLDDLMAAKKRREISEVFRSLPEETTKVYLDAVVEEMEKAKIDESLYHRTTYSGVSSRVAERMKKRLVDNLKKK